MDSGQWTVGSGQWAGDSGQGSGIRDQGTGIGDQGLLGRTGMGAGVGFAVSEAVAIYSDVSDELFWRSWNGNRTRDGDADTG